EALDTHQCDHARRMLLPQRFQLLHLARLDELADLVGGALADPLDLLQLLCGQLSEIGRLGGDRLSRAFVGADTKRRRVALVENRQLGELPQHVEDVLLGVGHRSCCTLAPVSKEEAAEVLSIEGREVRVTHPSKLYFSRDIKVTKLELVRYYLSVAKGALQGI